MADHEALNLFGMNVVTDETVAPGTAELRQDGKVVARLTVSREAFLTGLLAQWAASDREPGAKPTPEEKRRAAEAARAALGQNQRPGGDTHGSPDVR